MVPLKKANMIPIWIQSNPKDNASLKPGPNLHLPESY
jgi:hypothetical protein